MDSLELFLQLQTLAPDPNMRENTVAVILTGQSLRRLACAPWLGYTREVWVAPDSYHDDLGAHLDLLECDGRMLKVHFDESASAENTPQQTEWVAEKLARRDDVWQIILMTDPEHLPRGVATMVRSLQKRSLQIRLATLATNDWQPEDVRWPDYGKSSDVQAELKKFGDYPQKYPNDVASVAAVLSYLQTNA